MPVTGPYIDTPSLTTTIVASIHSPWNASFNRPARRGTPQLDDARCRAQRRADTARVLGPGDGFSLAVLTNPRDGRSADAFGGHFGEHLLASA